MPKLKVLSGSDVVSILGRFAFVLEKQQGSHVKLSRVNGGAKQVVGVPLHKELDRGTLKAIYGRACLYIPVAELWPHFYHDQ